MKTFSSIIGLLLLASFTGCDLSYNKDTSPDERTNLTRPNDGPANSDPQPLPDMPEPSADQPEAFSRKAMIAQAGQTSLATIDGLNQEMGSLVGAIEALCLRNDIVTEQAAQEQWLKVMDYWQFLSAFQMGPALAQQELLRVQIYGGVGSVNPCGIDREVVKLESQANYKLSEQASVTTLGSLEYLLFSTDHLNSCRSRPPLDQWDNRPLSERRVARCQYASLVAKKVEEFTGTLREAWLPGQYIDRFVKEDLTAEEQQALIQEIVTSLFYVDYVKNVKVRVPARYGKYQDNYCGGRPCPRNVEHYWSQTSKRSVLANLYGLRTLLTGQMPESYEIELEDGYGLTDYLDALGKDPVAQRLIDVIDETIQSLEDQEKSFYEMAKESDIQSCRDTTRIERLEPFCALYKDFKMIYENLSGEFIEVMKVKLPTNRSSGDGD